MDVKDLTGLSAKSSGDLREITRALCYFAARGSDTYVCELIEFLALSALSKLPPGAHHVQEILGKLVDLIAFKFEYEQILAALRRLEDKKGVYVVDGFSDDAARFGLDAMQISELTQKYKEQVSFEQSIMRVWHEELRQRHASLTDEELGALEDDLDIFALRLYSLHSVESASLYFGEDSKVFDLLRQLDEQSIRDILPERDEKLHGIRMHELPRFFLNAPVERKKYIAQQLNQIFILQMLQLDPTCARLASQEIKGGTLFLDTNFVIRLVGADGPELQDASERLLCLSQGLGYRTVVSPRTLEEYRFKMGDLVRRARFSSRIAPVVAKAALSVTYGRDFQTNYWQHCADPNGYPAQSGHYELYEQVEALLEQCSVAIDDTADEEIRADKRNLASEEALLLNALPDFQATHPSVIEHDAHHRLLILRLRAGYEEKTPLEIPFWFLTCDTKLPTYDRRVRPRLGLRFPFCVLSSHWMQLLRPFAAAVDGFEISQATNLDSPLFRLFPMPPKELIQDIISRIQAHEGIPPEITAKVITNTAFLRSFQVESDGLKRDEMLHDVVLQEVAELVDEERKEMEETRRHLGEQLKNLTEEKADLSAKLSNLEIQNSELQQRFQLSEEERQAYLRKRAELDENLHELETNHSKVEKQLAYYQSQHREAKLQREQQDERIEELKVSIQTMNREAFEQEAQNKEALLRLMQSLDEESKKRDQVTAAFEKQLARQKLLEARQQKTLIVVLTWIGCGTLLLATSPWSKTDNTKWLTVSFVILATVITQLVAFWNMKLNLIILAILVGINVIALVIAVALPLGIPLNDSVIWIMAIIQGVGAVYAMLQQNRN